MSRTDKIGLTFFVGILTALVVWVVFLFAHDISSRQKSDDYEACMKATRNIDGCEKEIYTERFLERQKKKAYYRKRVPVLE